MLKNGTPTDDLIAVPKEFFYTNNLAIIGNRTNKRTIKNFNVYYSPFKNFEDLRNLWSNFKTHLDNSRDLGTKNIVVRNFNFLKN